jgi:signal transduction histidine kinase
MNGSRAGYETARLTLARLRLTGEDARFAAVRQIAETGARALGVARASVWVMNDDHTRLECLCRYQVASGKVSAGDTVPVSPLFLAALAERRVLAVGEASSDARVAELRANGFLDAGVTSLLAAPIIRDGAVTGLVGLKHEGPPRAWSQIDRDFAACTADMMALFFEQADRLEIEAALRQRREAELQEDKMLALARLSRAVAHDLANVLGALDLMGASLEGDVPKDLRALGGSIRHAAEVGDLLIRQLSSFGREAASTRQPVDLVAIARAMEPVLSRLAGDVRFTLDATMPKALVLAEPGEMEQVLLNLCVNAVEAVTQSGQSRSMAGSTAGSVRIGLRRPSLGEPINPTFVVLSVADDGCGMELETQAHMFEPYFSRKAAGHGLGLSTVYGIVKRCEGTILVDSAPGSGTTLRVALPLAAVPV